VNAEDPQTYCLALRSHDTLYHNSLVGKKDLLFEIEGPANFILPAGIDS